VTAVQLNLFGFICIFDTSLSSMNATITCKVPHCISYRYSASHRSIGPIIDSCLCFAMLVHIFGR